MYSVNRTRGQRRTFTAPRRRSVGNKRAKQFIDPSRFVKLAQPAVAGDYTATNNFGDFVIHPILKNNIALKGYKFPSEIQDKAIPIGLSGKDIVGIANTGTGKTAAFAIPILNKLLHNRGSQALIIAPTRELAMQIEEQCIIFSKNSGLNGTLLIGGMAMSRQIRELRGRPQVIIGTPGRLKDHLQQGTLTLDKANMVVLDEVDRMLDMGFITDVRMLLSHLPTERQSFFFSATVNSEIESLIKTFTNEAVTIDVKMAETSDNVHQNVIRYSGSKDRIEQLHNVLIDPVAKKVLIFSETKRGAERLSNDLKARGFKVDALHGGKSQGQRKRALDGLREDTIDILVATDVAARGIDVPDITHVINFDTPFTYDDYIHRIGRAGRAGKVGHALTFIQNA